MFVYFLYVPWAMLLLLTAASSFHTGADLISSARMINSTFNWGNQDILGRVFLVHNRNELMLVLFPLPPQDFSCNTSHHHLMSCYPCGDPECLHKPPALPSDQNRCVAMTNNTTYLMLEHPRFNGCEIAFHAPTSTAVFLPAIRLSRVS